MVEDIQPSTRRYPFILFKPEREPGNDILIVDGLSKVIDGVSVLSNVSFTVNKNDKIAFIGSEHGITALFKILAGEMEPDSGSYKYGITITHSYFPKDNAQYFDGCDLNLIDWMRQYSKNDSETYICGFLGKMLFAKEDALKIANVLSGGERVRCMFSRMMLLTANLLIFDQPIIWIWNPLQH